MLVTSLLPYDRIRSDSCRAIYHRVLPHVWISVKVTKTPEWCLCDHRTCECRSFIMICYMCMEQWWWFTLHSHINISHTQRSVRYTVITRTKVQRCYTVRQLSGRIRSCTYIANITRYRHNHPERTNVPIENSHLPRLIVYNQLANRYAPRGGTRVQTRICHTC